MGASMYLCLIIFLSFLTFCSLQERLCPLHELCYGSHNDANVFTKLSHIIKDNLYLLWIGWYKHINYGLNLLGI
jgi:hypothetical protein